MRTLLSVMTAFALVGAAWADTPTVVQAPSGKHVTYGDLGSPFNPAEGEIILDGLCMLDIPWQVGFGNTCGGQGVFGIEYDLQVADDVELFQPATLTGVAADYLEFYGVCAATVCISVYAGGCEVANETPLCCVEVAPDACLTLPDPYGYYQVRRYVVKQDLCELGEGRYYINMQPKMGDDWGYIVVDGQNICGDLTCDLLLRDGGDDNLCCDGDGAFGFPDWTPAVRWWGSRMSASYQIQVRFGPPVQRCVYTVTKAKLLANVCGQVCDVCPYSRGDLVCTNQCPDGNAQCATKLKGSIACRNGAACDVVATFTACAPPPRNCKRCYFGPEPEGDGTADCVDGCPDDPNKTDPGQCGCGNPDTDSDGDGTADCVDNCPHDPNPGQDDSDGDGIGNACDAGCGDPNAPPTGQESIDHLDARRDGTVTIKLSGGNPCERVKVTIDNVPEWTRQITLDPHGRAVVVFRNVSSGSHNALVLWNSGVSITYRFSVSISLLLVTTWELPVVVGGLAMTFISITNISVTTVTCGWIFRALAAGGPCEIEGPRGFDPPSGVTTVAPGQTIVTPVTALAPMAGSDGQHSCFEVDVSTDTGVDTVMGSLTILNSFRVAFGRESSGEEITYPQQASMFIEIENITDQTRDVSYQIAVEPSDMSHVERYVSLNGQSPGTPIRGTHAAIQPGETRRVDFTVRYIEHRGFEWHDLLLFYDLNGDDSFSGNEIVATQPIRSVSPCTGSETLTAKCKGHNGNFTLVTKSKQGTPGNPATFRLDGGMSDISKTYNNRGKAKAKFPGVMVRAHTVELIECERFIDVSCP